MFVGRKNELQKLEKYYNDQDFHCIIMYGRRRVGKTYLLQEWMQNKRSIYFAAEQQNFRVLLNKFSARILSQIPSGYIHQFEDFEQAIRYIAEAAIDEPMILVFDEVQFLAQQDPSFLSMLQNIIDHHLLSTKLKLVLCGSYMSFMESEVLGHKSPIFGRRTASFKIEPFTYIEAKELLKADSDLEAFQAWAVLGGMPMYLNQYDARQSLKENIINKILDKGTLLHNEPLFALKQELKEPALYFSIIEAISSGKSKYKEISTFIGTEAGYYLNTLIELGIVKKITPIGDKPSSRKSVYEVTDSFFAFWFRYVSRGYSLVEMEKQELLYSELIEPDIQKFLGYRFETYCIEYLMSLNGTPEIPFVFTEIGKWWGNNPTKKQQEEIDIVAWNNNEEALIAECKWRNEKTGIKELEKLVMRSNLIPRSNKHLIFFSKSSYTKQAKDYAKEKDIRLINFPMTGSI